MRLCINVDHVATLREARKTFEPDPVRAAILAEHCGVDGIVTHLREDRRHIKEKDLELIRKVINIKLNLEMAATDEMFKIAERVLPDEVTIVPERREELTTEGGFCASSRLDLKPNVERLKRKGISVSIFVDPDEKEIEASKKIGADSVEIHTGSYANAKGEEIRKELERIKEAAKFAKDIGLFVKAGHGLTYMNVCPICGIKEIEELSIGHSIIANSIYFGIEGAIKRMIDLIRVCRK